VSQGKPLPTGTRVLVEPIRVSEGLPKRFDEGLVQLLQLLRQRLSSIGVIVLTQEETDLALAGLHPEGQNLYSPSTGKIVKRRVVEERLKYLSALAEKDACDMVVTPSLVVRKAEFMGTKARWDGVIRRIPIDYVRMGAGGIKVKGTDPGLSLGIIITDLNNDVIHKSIGGIDLLYRYGNLVTEEDVHAEIRPNALEDPVKLRESVAVALHPLVPFDGYSKKPVFIME
jgi:hypothetical protein